MSEKQVIFTWDSVEDAQGYNIYIKTQPSQLYVKENENLLVEEEFMKVFIAGDAKSVYSIYVEAVKGDKVSLPSSRVNLVIDGSFLFYEDFDSFEVNKGDNWNDPNTGTPIGGLHATGSSRVKIRWDDATPDEKHTQVKYVPGYDGNNKCIGTERINHPFHYFRFDPQLCVEFSYDIYFETIWSFDTVGENPLYPTGYPFQTGKLHGIGPRETKIITGSQPPITDGWSIRNTWLRSWLPNPTHNVHPNDSGYEVENDTELFPQSNTKPTLSIYVHDQDKPVTGGTQQNPTYSRGIHYPILPEHSLNGFTGLERHKWYTIKLLVQVNTPGVNDGIAELQVFDRAAQTLLGKRYVDSLRLRDIDTDDSKIRMLLYSTFFGGGDIKFAPPHTRDANGVIELNQKEFTDNGNVLHVYNDNLVDQHNGYFNRQDNFIVSEKPYYQAPSVQAVIAADEYESNGFVRINSPYWSDVTGIEYYLGDEEYNQDNWLTYNGDVTTITSSIREIIIPNQTNEYGDEVFRIRLKIGSRYTARTQLIEYTDLSESVEITFTSVSPNDEITPGETVNYTISLAGDTTSIDRIEYNFNNIDVENVTESPYSKSYQHTNIQGFGAYTVFVKAYDVSNVLLGENQITLQVVSDISISLSNLSNPIQSPDGISFNYTISDPDSHLTLPASGLFRLHKYVNGVPVLQDEQSVNVSALTALYTRAIDNNFYGNFRVFFRVSGSHQHMVGTHSFYTALQDINLITTPEISTFIATGMDGRIRLIWSVSNRGSDITEHAWSIDGEEFEPIADNVLLTGSHDFPDEEDLVNGQQYSVQLRSTNAVGSSLSPIRTATPSGLPIVAVDVQYNGQSTNLIPGSVTFTDAMPAPLELAAFHGIQSRFHAGPGANEVSGLDPAKTYTAYGWVYLHPNYNRASYEIRPDTGPSALADLDKKGQWQYLKRTWTGITSLAFRTGGSGNVSTHWLTLLKVEEGAVANGWHPPATSRGLFEVDYTTNNNGKTITTRRWRFRKLGEEWGSWLTLTQAVAVFTHAVANGFQYEVQVQAINDNGSTVAGDSNSVGAVPVIEQFYVDEELPEALKVYVKIETQNTPIEHSEIQVSTEQNPRIVSPVTDGFITLENLPAEVLTGLTLNVFTNRASATANTEGTPLPPVNAPILSSQQVGDGFAIVAWQYRPGIPDFSIEGIVNGIQITVNSIDTGNLAITNWQYNVNDTGWVSKNSNNYTFDIITGEESVGVEQFVKIRAINSYGEGFESAVKSGEPIPEPEEIEVAIYYGDNLASNNTGAFKKSVPELQLLEAYSTTERIWAIDVDTDQNVYIGTRNGVDSKVIKFSPTGTVLNTFTGFSDHIQTVTVGLDGNVYACGNDNTVRKLNSSLVQQWSTNIGASAMSVADDRDGNVIVGREGGNMYKLNGASGAVIWTYTTSANTVRGVAVDRAGNCYGSDGNNVIKVSPAGTLLVTFNGHSDSIRDVCTDNRGFLYTVDSNGILFKLQQENLTQAWTKNIAADIRSLAVDVHGNIFAGGVSGVLRGYDEDGESILSETVATGTLEALSIPYGKSYNSLHEIEFTSLQTLSVVDNDNGDGTYDMTSRPTNPSAVPFGNVIRLYYAMRGEQNMYFIESSDGISWGTPTQANLPSGFDGDWKYQVMYHNGWKAWADHGHNMHLFTSNDGITWTDVGIAFEWKLDSVYSFFFDPNKNKYVAYGRVRQTDVGGWESHQYPHIDRRGVSYHENNTWTNNWSNQGELILDPMDVWDYELDNDDEPTAESQPDIYRGHVFWNGDIGKYQGYMSVFWRQASRRIENYRGTSGAFRITGETYPVIFESTNGKDFLPKGNFECPIDLTPHQRLSNFAPPYSGERSNQEPTCPTCFEVGQIHSGSSAMTRFKGKEFIFTMLRDDTHYEAPTIASDDYDKIEYTIYVQIRG